MELSVGAACPISPERTIGQRNAFANAIFLSVQHFLAIKHLPFIDSAAKARRIRACRLSPRCNLLVGRIPDLQFRWAGAPQAGKGCH